MTLSGPQLKVLREALIEAFPRQDSLEEMVLDELDERLNIIVKSEDYRSVVRYFIEWAESRGRLRDVAIGASRANPGNKALRAAITELFVVLLEPPLFLSEQIISVLQSVQLFPVIAQCCQLTVPTLKIHRPHLLESIEDDRLSSDARWFIVMNLLLYDYPEQKGVPTILGFIHRLYQHPELPQLIQNDLRVQLNSIADKYNYNTALEYSNSLTSLSIILQGYLLIVVQPMTTNSSLFQVHGFLLIKSANQDNFTQSQLISIAELQRDETEQIQAGDSLLQRGTTCTLDELKRRVPMWVRGAKEQLAELTRGVDYSYELTVEFFLPYELLALDVDLWQIQAAIARLNRWEPLGKRHGVVVRSFDRLNDPGLLNDLKQSWAKAKQLLKAKIESAENGTFLQQMMQLSQYPFNSLCKQCLALKLVGGLPEQLETQEELFLAILEFGIPIVLWTRQGEFPKINLMQELDALIDLECLSKLDQLLERVRLKRESAHREAIPHEHPGYHLGLLCDEPERLERLNQFGFDNRLWGRSA